MHHLHTTPARLTAVVLVAILIHTATGARFPGDGGAIAIDGHSYSDLFGTTTSASSSSVNPFGADYTRLQAIHSTASALWAALCPLDSDGDGFTNGEELGDSGCTWDPSTPTIVARTTQLSHPGMYSSVPPFALFNRYRSTTGRVVRDPDHGSIDRTVTRTTISHPAVSTLTKLSEVVRVRELDVDADNLLPAYEDRSQCPHTQSGLLDWHSATTWPSGVPIFGSAVTLPASTKVLVSNGSFDPRGYASITIPAGSELIFGDTPINLAIKDMFVQGTLTLGSYRCPLHSPITISFVAEKSELGTYNNQMMATGTGTIAMHGTRNSVTWTRLSATIPAGSPFVFLQAPVTWAPGDEIVVATSIWKDHESDQNEVRRIKAVHSTGMVIEVDAPYDFKHYAGTEYQTEVGLLTRSILLRGASTASAALDAFGGQTMAVGEATTYVMIGVRAHRMGQQNVLASYPFHFHLKLDTRPTASTMQQCTCDSCYYRCVSVHKSNYTTVRKNVAYNVSGHTFYLEDGGEMHNRIEFNLAVKVSILGRPSEGSAQNGESFEQEAGIAIQPADHTASGFYISNPANIVVGNAASGGWAGFAYPIFPYTMHLSSDIKINPSTYPVEEFDGNTAHSSGYYWDAAGCVYFGGKLTIKANNEFHYSNGRFTHDTPKGTYHNISNLRTWLCQKGYASWGVAVEINNYEAHDVRRSAVLFGKSSVHRMLSNAVSRNEPSDMAGVSKEGFQFYDTWVQTSLVNVTFRNYHWRQRSSSPYNQDRIIVDLDHSDIYKPWGISATRDIRFQDSDPMLTVKRWIRETGASRMFNIVDWDGSLLRHSTCGAFIIGSDIDWWNANEPGVAEGQDCFYRRDMPAWICPRIVGREVVGLDMTLPGLQEELDILTGSDNMLTQANRDLLYIGHIAQFGFPDRNITITRNVHLASGLSGLGWYMYVKFGVPPAIKVRPLNFPTNGAFIMLAIPYPSGTTFSIRALKRWNTKVVNLFAPLTSREAVLNSNGTHYFFDNAEGVLYLKVSDMWSTYPNSYRINKVDIYSVYSDEAYIEVTANCGSNINSAGNCNPPSTPHNIPYLDIPITQCTDPTQQTRRATSLDMCPGSTQSDIHFANDSYSQSKNISDCTDYIARVPWQCEWRPSGMCMRSCNASCAVMAAYPVRCSFNLPCEVDEFRPASTDVCSEINGDDTANLYNMAGSGVRADRCRIKVCDAIPPNSDKSTIDADTPVRGRIRMVSLPYGVPCSIGEAALAKPGVCSGTGYCKTTGTYDSAAPVITRADPHHFAVSDRSVEVNVRNNAKVASISVAYQSTDGALTTSSLTRGSSGVYSTTLQHRVPRNVTFTTTLTNGTVFTYPFGDWHNTASVSPRITVSSVTTTSTSVTVTVHISPFDWVNTVGISPSQWTVASNPAVSPMVCDAITATCTATVSGANPFSTPGGAVVTVLMHTGNQINRTMPCLVPSSVGSACLTPTTETGTVWSSCKALIYENSINNWWWNIGDFTGIVTGVREMNGNTLNLAYSQYQGSGKNYPNPVLIVTLNDGGIEYFMPDFRAGRSWSPGRPFLCINGTNPTFVPVSVGTEAVCRASNGPSPVCTTGYLAPVTTTTTTTTPTTTNTTTATTQTTTTNPSSTTMVQNTTTTTTVTTATTTTSVNTTSTTPASTTTGPTTASTTTTTTTTPTTTPTTSTTTTTTTPTTTTTTTTTPATTNSATICAGSSMCLGRELAFNAVDCACSGCVHGWEGATCGTCNTTAYDTTCTACKIGFTWHDTKTKAGTNNDAPNRYTKSRRCIPTSFTKVSWEVPEDPNTCGGQLLSTANPNSVKWFLSKDISSEILDRLATMPSCSPHMNNAVVAAVVYSVSSSGGNTVVEMSLEAAIDDTMSSSLDHWRDQCVVPAGKAAVSNGTYSSSRALLSGSSQQLSPTSCVAPALTSSTQVSAALLASPVCGGCAPSDPTPTPSDDEDGFPIAIVVGVCVAVVAVGAIVAAVVVIRKRKSQSRKGMVLDEDVDLAIMELHLPVLDMPDESIDNFHQHETHKRWK